MATIQQMYELGRAIGKTDNIKAVVIRGVADEIAADLPEIMGSSQVRQARLKRSTWAVISGWLGYIDKTPNHLLVVQIGFVLLAVVCVVAVML